MDNEKLIPITDEMTAAERRAARKHNRSLWLRHDDDKEKKEDQIRVERYGNTDK